MNINMHGFGSSVFGSGFLTMGQGLKSTQQKMERQEARDRQVAFYENQKENLKNVKCETVEEIARKLELFHSYEDQIAAAKMAYNNEQMWHMMDESREIGEKVAEAMEKSKPKTPEERQEDLIEEITGTEDGGILEELDEVMEEALELQEELQDVQQEMPADAMQQDVQQEMPADAMQQDVQQEMPADAMQQDVQQEMPADAMQQDARQEVTADTLQKTSQEELQNAWQEMTADGKKALYLSFDIKI